MIKKNSMSFALSDWGGKNVRKITNMANELLASPLCLIKSVPSGSGL